LYIPVIVSIVSVIVMFLCINKLFGFLIFGYVLIHLGIIWGLNQTAQTRSLSHAQIRGELQGHIMDNMMNHMARRLFARASYERTFIKKYQLQELRAHQEALVYVEKIRLLLGIVCFILAGAGINGLGIYCWIHGSITVGDLVILFQVTTNVINLLWWTSMELPQVFQDLGICRQAAAMLSATSEPSASQEASRCPMQIRNGRIDFQHVTFSYLREDPLFQELSVSIEPGQKVGFVGYSGSGKTTFVHLILRLFEIQSGSICIDGHDITQVDTDSLRSQIAVVPQAPMLFHRTVFDNVRYGRLQANLEMVRHFCRLAQADDFIMNLPYGYETVIGGDDGVQLSGGQMQRLSIARALIKQSRLYIWDEATSALDSETEHAIQQTIVEQMHGKTVIVIAHRLSTIQKMDRILVFNQGRIVEDGSPHQLLQFEGLYHRLWNGQMNGFL
jgi:ATP-binding cassette subfamily B protein